MNSSTITRPSDGPRSNDRAPEPKRLATWLLRIDESEKATFVIDAWLALDPEAQHGFLAQLIAAAIHAGPGSTLEQFAATGILQPEAALQELNEVTVPLEREGWVDALGRYILATAGGRS